MTAKVPDRLDLRLLLPALAAWVAVAIGCGLPVVACLVGAVVAAALAAVAVTGGRQHTLLGASAALIALGLSGVAAHGAAATVGPVGSLAGQRAVVTVTALITEQPHEIAPKRGSTGDSRLFATVLTVESVTARAERTEVGTPVLVLGDESWAAIPWRSRIEVTGRLRAADPGDDVVAVLAPSGPVRITEGAPWIVELSDVVRERFRQACSGLPDDARGLVPALVLGDTSTSPADLNDAMRDTGLTHLSAVSGSNVSIVLAAAIGLGGLLGLRRRYRPILAAVVLAGFVVLVRPEPSVLRATVMGCVGLAGLSRSRRVLGVPALAAAVAVLLVLDPWLSRSYGFALSTLATLGLLLFARPWGDAWTSALTRRSTGPPGRLRRLVVAAGPALATPLAAQVACAPVLVLLQPTVSLVAVPANLAAEPLVAPATIIGVAVAILSCVWVPGAGVLAWLAGLPALGICAIARTGAQVPMGSVPWLPGATGALLLAALTLLAIAGAPWLRHQVVLRPLAALGALVLVVASVAPTRTLSWPLPGWQLVVCDVGQGDGMVLADGDGHAVVVDTGPDPARIDRCLTALHVSVVDVVVLTHYHADHVEGLPGVLHGRTVGQVLVTPVRDPPEEAARVDRWLAAAGVPQAVAFAGDDYSWGASGAVRAHVWWPARVVHAGSVPNNASVVMTVTIAPLTGEGAEGAEGSRAAAGAGASPDPPGSLRVLLLGDVEKEAAAAVRSSLEAAGLFSEGAIDVLKVAHHGSANRDDALYAQVRAPVAVISVGAGNDYGHPAASTLTALRSDGYEVHRTDIDGDIAIRRTPGATGDDAAGRMLDGLVDAVDGGGIELAHDGRQVNGP